MASKIKNTIRRCISNFIWSTTRLKNNQVFFSSFSGGSYSDNPKALSEKLHEISPDTEIVWLNNGTELKGSPSYIKQIDRNNKIAYYKAMASSKVVVENFGFGDIPKKKNQYYIQVWHGDRAFKKIIYDSPFVGNLVVMEAKPGFCDLAIAGSEYGEMQFRSAFHYKGEVLKVGTPRDDILVNISEDIIKQKKKEMGLKNDDCFLLYAPTLRRANQHSKVKQSIQGIDLVATLKALENKFGHTWRCIVRSHPGVNGLADTGIDESLVVDMSAYPDMADLLIVSDVLITDYSSSAGDFALLNRPIFLFQDDIEDYLKYDRSFYFEMTESPYLIAHSQSELERLIQEVSSNSVLDNCKKILEFYGTNETGRASQAVVDRILEYIKRP